MLAREIHGKRFVTIENTHGRSGAETVFGYRVDGMDVHGSYSGGEIRIGQLVGRVVADDRIELLFQCVTIEGSLLSGRSSGTVTQEPDGRLRLDFEWEWLTGESGSGASSYIEAPEETPP